MRIEAEIDLSCVFERLERLETEVATLSRAVRAAPNERLDELAAAEALGIGRTKLYELRRAGEIRWFPVGRKVMFRRADIEEFIQRNATRTQARGALRIRAAG